MHSGELIYHFLNVVVLTAMTAPWILWRYRLAVLKGMRASSDEVVPVAETADRENITAPAGASEVLRWNARARRNISVALAAGIVPASLLMTGLYLMVSDYPRSPAHVWLISSVFASAAVPMAAAFLAIPFWRALANWCLIIGACSLFGVGLAAAQKLLNGQTPSLDQFMIVPYFLLFVGVEWSVPLLLLWVTGARRLRGVAPVTFACLLVFGLAPLTGARLTAWAANWEGAGPWLLSMGPNAGFIFIALPTGWLAWRRLKAVASAYESKLISDAQLLARTWWLMFVASVAITLANVHEKEWLTIFSISAIAYFIFPGCLAWTLERFHAKRPRPPARTLLLLRVFGYRARTEKLFDRIAARWRLLGPVTMIAGPDVVARTVDPGDFLRYLSGNLSQAFVNTREHLDSRLANFDRRPDPDGRYRINEFCCRENTWQATIVELMRQADAVVMDARGMTSDNRGCEFELRQLAERMRAAQIVLLIDGETDESLIESSMPGGAALKRPTVVDLSRQTAAATNLVFTSLIAAAYGN